MSSKKRSCMFSSSLMPMFVLLFATCCGICPLLLGVYTITPLNVAHWSAKSFMLTPSGRQSSGTRSAPLALARISQSYIVMSRLA